MKFRLVYNNLGVGCKRKREVEDDRFEGISKDVKKLLRYRSRTINSLESSWGKKCSSCNYIKPLRSHHCSICNRCVFLMDHHCRKYLFSILSMGEQLFGA